MKIFAIGVNYKTAPVEIREKLAFSNDEYNNILKSLISLNCVYEICVLSTCNRVEIYGIADNEDELKTEILKTLSQLSSISEEILENHMFFYFDNSAIKHIFRVSASLDSMVIGGLK